MKYDFSFARSAAVSLAGLFLGAAALLPAQAQMPLRPAAPVSAPPASAGYALGPGDVISIDVINFPELSSLPTTVPPDGKINVKFINGLAVSGKTTTQIADALTQKWSAYVVDPSVTVTLTQQRKQSLEFYGHVIHPQTVDYRPNLHLVSALAEVGGFADDGDASQVTVTRSNGVTQTVDLTDPQTKGGTAEDILLAPNDTVYVPQRHTQVSVLGAVVKPGSFEFADKMTVLDALKDADNTNPETADLSGATLTHNGQETPLNLKALLHDGKLENNVMLAAGDSIFVPTLSNFIYVDGAVLKPGTYAFKPGDRLVDAIIGCGGTQANFSDLAKVSVVQMDKAHNTATKSEVDVAKFYRTGSMQSNPILVPNEAVYIPVKGVRTDPISIVGNLIGIGNNTRVLTRPY